MEQGALVLGKVTKHEILQSLNTPEGIERALSILYRLQTQCEAVRGVTINRNNMGFNAYDAYILTLYAKRVLAGIPLRKAALDVSKIMLPKYAGQIARVLNGEMEGITL
jgi:hypothetical protein